MVQIIKMENLGKESQKEKDEENKQKCIQTDRQTDRDTQFAKMVNGITKC